MKSSSEEVRFWGPREAQSVKHITLGFASGHDFRVVNPAPHPIPPWDMEPAYDSLPRPSFPTLLKYIKYVGGRGRIKLLSD